MIGFPLWVLLIMLGCLYYVSRKPEPHFQGSPRTTRQDKAYLWHYETARNRRPIASRIALHANIPFQFQVEERKKRSHLLAWLMGFCNFVTLNDTDGELSLCVASDSGYLQAWLRTNASLAALVMQAFRQGASELYTQSDVLIVRLKQTQSMPPAGKSELLTDILYDINQLLSTAPVVPFRTKFARQGQVFFRALPSIFLSCAVLAFLLNLMLGYQVIFWKPLGWLAIKAFLLINVCVLVLMRILFCRSASQGMRVLKDYLRHGTWSALVAALLMLWFTNCHYDTSLAEPHDLAVLTKYTTQNRKSVTHHIRVSSWDVPDHVLVLQVTGKLYNGIRVGDKVRVFSSAGFWNMEWIEKVERAE